LKELDILFRVGYLCNDAKLVYNHDEPDNSDGSNSSEGNNGYIQRNAANNTWSIIGDPTEGSLIVMSKKGGLDEKYVEKDY